MSLGLRVRRAFVNSKWPSKADMCKGVSVKIIGELILCKINGSCCISEFKIETHPS